MISEVMELASGPDEWEAELERAMPWIAWTVPVIVTPTAGPRRYGCRYCIAKYGISLDDRNGLAETMEEFENHMANFHDRFPFTPKAKP